MVHSGPPDGAIAIFNTNGIISCGRARLAGWSLPRAGAWWNAKLAPAAAIFYATASGRGAPLWPLWPQLLLLLFALAACAVYVSLINDLADRRADEQAGKANLAARMSRAGMLLALLAAMAAGALMLVHWRHAQGLAGLYLASWLSFSCYSLPPFSFKRRGLAGVLADAAGAHLFPALLAAGLAFDCTGSRADPAWLAPVGIWAFCVGGRGILWHQLDDAANDAMTGTGTFAVRHSPAAARGLAVWILFPCELLALGMMMAKLGNPAPVIALALYAMLAGLRYGLAGERPLIVTPRPGRQMFLQDYYTTYFPLAILVAAGMRSAQDIFMLLLHMALFPLCYAAAVAGLYRLLVRAR